MPAQNKFSILTPDTIQPIIKQALANYQSGIDKILSRHRKHTFSSLMLKLEKLVYEFNLVWQPISHLNDVKKSPEYTEKFDEIKKQVTEFHLNLFQNPKLFKAIQKLEHSNKFKNRPPEQQELIRDYLRNFKLSGISLPENSQIELKYIRKTLSELKEQFANNKTESIDSWSKIIIDEAELSGLPESTKQAAKELAESKNEDGWLLTLAPNVLSDVIRFADSRALRKEMVHAHNVTASALADNPDHDNAPIMVKILALKQREAKLLGFKDHVDLSLSTKMATREAVEEMLVGLAKEVKPQAEAELQRLKNFAKKTLGIKKLQPYDISYVANKLKETEYDIDDKKVKEYFPADFVLSGMFEIVRKLFGIVIKEEQKFDSWDKEVKLFSLHTESGEKLGEIYMDLFARNGEKRGGAWMNQCEDRFKYKHSENLPIAFLNTNFGQPTKDQPALLSHREVQTTFHEFGHCLHHILSQVNYPSIAGPNGVPWDAVEAPSQMMENWIWDATTLKMLSKHYKTGETLPDSLIESINNLRNYNAGINELQQLCYAMFDFKLHTITSELKAEDIQKLWLAARNSIHVFPTTSDDYMPNTFHHIFAGAYSAGYYSYNWALNISHNLFNKFKEQGIINSELGKQYVADILAPGGSQDFMKLVTQFLGKAPNPKALADAIKTEVPHSTHSSDYNPIVSSSKQESSLTRIIKKIIPASILASKFFIPAILALIPITLSLIPSSVFPAALPIGLVSGLVTGGVVFASSLAVSLLRSKLKSNALEHYANLSSQENPEISQTEVDVIKLGMDSAQSIKTRAMSCFQWQAYSSAYYAGLKAQEDGEILNFSEKVKI